MGGFHVVEPSEGRSNGANTDTQGTDEKTDAETGSVSPGQKPEGRVTILTLEMLRELVKDKDFELIFLTQSTWFILQCLARRIQRLDLTHLELTTLALASLNGITFALWWAKPLGAQTIVRVYLNRKLTGLERVAVDVSSSSISLFFFNFDLWSFRRNVQCGIK